MRKSYTPTCCSAGLFKLGFGKGKGSYTAGMLPRYWRPLLPDGQLLAGLILSTVYSEKYNGRSMNPDDCAEVTLPMANDEVKTMSARLLHRSGSREVSAFVWWSEDDNTIYVAFNPMRKPKQLFKLLSSFSVDEVEFERPGGEPHKVNVYWYVSRKLDHLYGKYDFGRKLAETVAEFPNARILFCGISHGAAMAQASAFKFQVMHPSADVNVVAFNAYKWTDAAGSKLVTDTFGERMLPITLSRADNKSRRWDSVAGCPYGLSPMANIVLIDADSGDFYPCTDPGNVRFTPLSMARAYELHFAKPFMKALKKATVNALAESQKDDGNGLFRRSFTRMRTLQWGSKGDSDIGPLVRFSEKFEADHENLMPGEEGDFEEHSEHGSDGEDRKI